MRTLLVVALTAVVLAGCAHGSGCDICGCEIYDPCTNPACCCEPPAPCDPCATHPQSLPTTPQPYGPLEYAPLER